VPGQAFDFAGCQPILRPCSNWWNRWRQRSSGRRTAVKYLLLQDSTSHRCKWCGLYAKESAKGWQCYKAVDHSIPGGVKVMGEVCGNPECR
jgi:hypothetical protein